MKHYRDAISHREISNILAMSLESSENIVWQNMGEIRHVFSILNYQFDQQRVKLTVQEAKDFHPKAGIPLYGKLACKQSIFKTEILEVGDGLIQIRRPNSMKAVELRGGPRFKFAKNQNKRVKLIIGSKETAFTALSVKAEDISTKGIGVQVEVKDNTLDYVGRKIMLGALGANPLEAPIECELMYTRRYKGVVNNKVVERARLGLRLKDALCPDALKGFVETK